MKKQNLVFIILSIIVVIITFIFVKEIIPIFKEKESKNRVFKDMQDKSYSKFKIFTKDTEFSGQTIKASDSVNFEIPDDNYYESLLYGKVEYISQTDDLAILSFEYNGDLTVLDFNNKELSVNDKIMVIGHPEGNKYRITYGYIKSGLKNVSDDKVIEHNAYTCRYVRACGFLCLNHNVHVKAEKDLADTA